MSTLMMIGRRSGYMTLYYRMFWNASHCAKALLRLVRMSEIDDLDGLPPQSATFDEAGFDLLVAEIAAGSIAREQERQLPYEIVRRVAATGFGSARIPAEAGGEGASLETLFSRLIRLAAADSNIAHVFRGHLGFVEQLNFEPNEAVRQKWYSRVLAGAFFGNAQSERTATSTVSTALDRSSGAPLLNGRKFYTTGSIYADWIDLAAIDGDTEVQVLAPSADPGVTSIDDWNGFGQRLTGSGTTIFDNAVIDQSDVRPYTDDPDRDAYITSIFQLVLLAVVAGIAQNALNDTVAFVQPRSRIWGYAGQALPRQNHLVQTVVGDLSSAAFASREIVLSNARELDRALGQRGATREILDARLNVYRSQQVVLPLVLKATSDLFEVGGASAVTNDFALDRHWRNARTVASHNPAIQRKRSIGDYELNGQDPQWGLEATPNETGKP
jgi:alkylation response protein AidB-like acyl-CoA dehydrogenase